MDTASYLCTLVILAALFGLQNAILIGMGVVVLHREPLPIPNLLNDLTDFFGQQAHGGFPCLRWLQVLFRNSKTPELILSEFNLDERQRRVWNVADAGFEWVITHPVSVPNQAHCAYEKAKLPTGHYEIPPSATSTDPSSCWSLLMRDLHEVEALHEQLGAYTSSRNITFIGTALKAQHDLGKTRHPLVKTTVHDMAIIARRLGLGWTVFKPEEGIVSANGKNRVLYSTFEPSLGTLLHYTTTGDVPTHPMQPSTNLMSADLFIQTRQAAMMGFGILPGSEELKLPDYHISSTEDVYHTLNLLDPSCKASQKVRDVRGIVPTSMFGVWDLIPMAAPIFRLRGSTITRIPVPTEDCLGLTSHTAGFVVFRERLGAYVEARKETDVDKSSEIYDRYRALQEKYPEWEDEVEANKEANGRGLEFLEEVHDNWDWTTNYFRIRQARTVFRISYADLLAAHIKHAVNYWGDAWSNIREGKAREHYGHRDWMAEGAHCYWDYLPEIAKELTKGQGMFEDEVKEAWIMLMFRAMCWWRCHWMMEGTHTIKDSSTLPTRYWGSKQPVFIG